MSDLEPWVTIVGLALVTLATRVSMLFLPARIELPLRLQRALRHAGPCILMAIVVPDLMRHGGVIDVGFDNLRLMAAIVAVLAFVATRSATLMIAAGMLALTVLRLL